MSLKLLEKLLPPDDPHRLTQWRWILAMCVMALVLNAAIGHNVLGFGGFAYAADVENNGKKIDRMLVLSLATTLRNLRIDECRANGSRSAIRSTMEVFQQEYKELTGSRYPLPQCDELST